MKRSKLIQIIREEINRFHQMNEMSVGDSVYIKKDKKSGTVSHIHSNQRKATVEFGDGVNKVYSFRDLTTEGVILERKLMFPLERSFSKKNYKVSKAAALIDTDNYKIQIVHPDNTSVVYSTSEYGSSPSHFTQAQNSLWKHRTGKAKVVKEGLDEALNEEEYDYWRDYQRGLIDKATYDKLSKRFQKRNRSYTSKRRKARKRGEPVYLDIKYREKDDLKRKYGKALRWDPDKKSWYYLLQRGEDLPTGLEKRKSKKHN